MAAILLVVAWSERKAIATRTIDQLLREQRVAVKYRITELGLGRQRLTRVIVGDPRRPDLIADTVELQTRIGLTGPRIVAVHAEGLRLRGRLVDDRLSFGSLDRLIPHAAGRAPALPALALDLVDARARIDSALGTIGLRLDGHGGLDHDFSGRLALMTSGITAAGCMITPVRGLLTVATIGGVPRLAGPLGSAAIACHGSTARALRVRVALAATPQFDGVTGRINFSADAASGAGAGADRVVGTTSIALSSSASLSTATRATATGGRIEAMATRLGTPAITLRRVSFTGPWRLADGVLRVRGTLHVADGALSPELLHRIDGYRGAATATPLEPIAQQLGRAARAALMSFSADAALSAVNPVGEKAGGAAGQLVVSGLQLASHSGARLVAVGNFSVGGPASAIAGAGSIRLGGGGLPELHARLARIDGDLSGTIAVAPIVTPTARLGLAPIRIDRFDGGTRIVSRAALTGSFAGGKIINLTLPIDLLSDHGGVRLDPVCVPLGFDRIVVGGTDLNAGGFWVCPLRGGLVTLDAGRVGGGFTIGRWAIAGRTGSTPIGLAGESAQLDLVSLAFAATGLAVRVGVSDPTRIDLDRIDGVARPLLHGRFGGGSGKLARVPLIVSAASGDWRVEQGQLTAHAALIVADGGSPPPIARGGAGDAAASAGGTAVVPRFRPVAAHDVVLHWRGGSIGLTGSLFDGRGSARLADLVIAHDLISATGHADIAVPGIVFDQSLQPDALTPLTLGIVADVRGRVEGAARIDWQSNSLTSTGRFRTAGIDLAAPFGPATGIAGAIEFTDLLALVSAPGQRLTVASINPGVPVDDGVITYQTLANSRIAITRGYWPYAGGSLVLEPTTLDFAQRRERRMTFTVSRIGAGQFLQQFNFPNLNATGSFDGQLPMIFDDTGGRIVDGRLRIAHGGGTIAYVGELSQKDLGFWGNFAFQSLKSLRYRALDIVMNGPLAGEMVTEVHFAGIAQGKGAKRNFLLDRLQRLPLVFNVRIRAPFRQLIDSAQSFYDPKRLVERNLPALIEEQQRRSGTAPAPSASPPTIQPPESRRRP